MGHMGRTKYDVMFGRVRQVAASVGGRIVRTRGIVCYPQLPCFFVNITQLI